MRATIVTTGGPITWDSTGNDAGEVHRLVDNWHRWVAGDNPRQFAHLAHNRGGVNIYYRDIVSIDIEED